MKPLRVSKGKERYMITLLAIAYVAIQMYLLIDFARNDGNVTQVTFVKDEASLHMYSLHVSDQDRFTINEGSEHIDPHLAPCSGCTKAQPLAELNTPVRRQLEGIPWRELFPAGKKKSKPAVRRTKRIATIICSGASLKKLRKEEAAFIKDHTDAWGVSVALVGNGKKQSTLRQYGIHLKFLHFQPRVPMDEIIDSHNTQRLTLDPSITRDTTLICEQDCQWVGHNLPGKGYRVNNKTAPLFKDYVTYKRACINQDCEPLASGLRPYEYSPQQDGDAGVRVPLESSFNRVVDIVVRLNYDAVLIAGCDNLSEDGQLFQGKKVHESHLYGYLYWQMAMDEFFVGFLHFNRIQALSLTPGPLTEQVETQGYEVIVSENQVAPLIKSIQNTQGNASNAPETSKVYIRGYSLRGIKVRSMEEIKATFDMGKWSQVFYNSPCWRAKSLPSYLILKFILLSTELYMT